MHGARREAAELGEREDLRRAVAREVQDGAGELGAAAEHERVRRARQAPREVAAHLSFRESVR